MPVETAKSAGIFTFGTGIIVGLGAAFAMRATMPRATEFVGLMLQKMGFELGDMLLALWDPEATYQQTAALPGSGSRSPGKKKKRLTDHARATVTSKTAHNGTESILKLPKIRRSTLRTSGKSPKLPSARRGVKARAIVGLN
jgi:hypothetical protein